MPWTNNVFSLDAAATDAFPGKVLASTDWNTIFTQIIAGLGAGAPNILGGLALAVNLNSANTDTTISITLPTGCTRYIISRVLVFNLGVTASLTTATAGLFSQAAGAGLALAANQALSPITSATINTDANTMPLAITVSDRTILTLSSVFFRVGTAQGAAATANVYVQIRPLP